MSKVSIIVTAIIALAVIIGVLIYMKPQLQQAPATENNGTSAFDQSEEIPLTIVSSSSTTTVVNGTAAQSFKVNGNDASADLTNIVVSKGTKVTITFGADAGTTYHGGLDFKSSVVDTGTIAPGSTKTVSFTADKSFAFTPYWPSTNIAKPYQVNIVVK